MMSFCIKMGAFEAVGETWLPGSSVSHLFVGVERDKRRSADLKSQGHPFLNRNNIYGEI